MKILFLSRWFPEPPDNGSKIRIFNVLRQLGARHEVTLLAFRGADEVEPVDGASNLRAFCREVRAIPYRPFRPTSARAVRGLLSAEPRFLVDTRSSEMTAAIRAAWVRATYDLVIASQLDMLPYALDLNGAPRLLEELELGTFLDGISPGASPRRRVRALLTWLKLRAYLRRALPRFAACSVVSEREREWVRRVAPTYGPVVVIPNAVNLADYVGSFGEPVRGSLILPGALTYAANYDALRFFLGEVYPLLGPICDHLTLRVTGSTRGIDLATLPRCDRVQYTGHVPDVRPLISQSWGTLVPLRLGGGTRLKILESLALGTPVVATSKGAEGLAVTDGENILIADEPRAFAARVIELLESPRLREQLAAAGRRLVASHYDWHVVGRQLDALIEEIAA